MTSGPERPAEERQIRILGGRSRARARVEARTCDTQLSSEAHHPAITLSTLCPSRSCCGTCSPTSIFLTCPSHFWPFTGMQKRNKPPCSDPLKILPSRNVRRKRQKELVLSARLPSQAQQVVLQRYCMTARQAKRRLPSSLRRPLVGQRPIIIA